MTPTRMALHSVVRSTTMRVVAANSIAGMLSGLLLTFAASAQVTTPEPGNPQQQTVSDPQRTSSESSSLTSFGGQNGTMSSAGVLGQSNLPSSEWIIQTLQSNEDLLIEVKQLVATKLTELGQPTSANDISDEQLFQQIENNQALRAQLGSFLRARGDTPPQATADETSTPGDAYLPGTQRNQDSLFTSQRPLSSDARREAALLSGALPRSRTDEDALAVRRTQQEQTEQENQSSTPLHRPTPYNLRSLRDVYTQLPEPSQKLKRFGSTLFLRRGFVHDGEQQAGSDTPLDVPLGPDYVLGAGDALNINIWGSVSQTITRTVDRDGRVALPEAGALDVAGLPLSRAEQEITSKLRKQFRDANVTVTVSHVRTVRVYIAGDVQRPGGYDISSLSTPVGALVAAGGPTANGSMRLAKHLRAGKLIETVDLYSFLLHGVQANASRFESGDTLLVPPTGPQVAIAGAVRRPAIYELAATENVLSDVLADAGGTTAGAALDHIVIERVAADKSRETITVSANALPTFVVRDEDHVTIPAILPYSQRAVYLQGHVVRPGRFPFADGMRITGLLHSYRDMLPEPADRGELIRLVPPDLHAETIAFSVPEVMAGNGDLALQPLDTIRIFGRYEVDSPSVSIHGEVLRPGNYPLSSGMTAADLVRMAGGFKRDALHASADLVSYTMTDRESVHGDFKEVRIGDAVDRGERAADVPLKAGDVLTIHQLSGWSDVGQSVTLEGQLRFPGSYGFREGERLSSVLQRAGGFRDTAYPQGAVLVREQVKDLEQKSRDELIRQIETNSASARLSPALGSGDTGQTLELIKAQQTEVLNQLRSHPPNGRLVIHIGADIHQWANTDADVELRPGDVVTIPKRPGFVLVQGQVYNPTALSFTSGKTAGWYLARAGGANSTANRKDVFVIRANGTVIGRHSSGFFGSDVLSTKLDPGDVVVMPQKIIGSSLVWRNLLTAAQLASSIAITAAVAAL